MGTKYDVAAGIVLAPVAYYAASLASALWLSGQQSLVVIATLISVVLFAGLSVISSLRATLSMVLSVTILLLLAISFLLGGSEYAWAAPLPFDIASLFFHGSRTPIVFCVAASALAASIMKLRSRKKTVAALTANDS
ncbi:hypothetical protein [Leucobacter sp. wl10]|uniref:hypothetical protein n=1 Tax=Leucobacter sp. wl10 TaxID=2304677 RepID=UPI0013C31F81|nr:hypothetical protein [Leucobacter sp. wl10]